MRDLDYNLYIENYLANDKTKSAIMLTAPWGMGKSYYIQNSLIAYGGLQRQLVRWSTAAVR